MTKKIITNCQFTTPLTDLYYKQTKNTKITNEKKKTNVFL